MQCQGDFELYLEIGRGAARCDRLRGGTRIMSLEGIESLQGLLGARRSDFARV